MVIHKGLFHCIDGARCDVTWKSSKWNFFAKLTKYSHAEAAKVKTRICLSVDLRRWIRISSLQKLKTGHANWLSTIWGWFTDPNLRSSPQIALFCDFALFALKIPDFEWIEPDLEIITIQIKLNLFSNFNSFNRIWTTVR